MSASQKALSWPEAIVFDLDGTIVDSAADIMAALNLGFTEAGHGAYSVGEVRGMIGGGVPALVDRAVKLRALTPSESEHAALKARVKAAYDAAPVVKTAPYPGAVELLESLTAQGVRCGICTNKPTDITRQVLEALFLDQYFGAVIGGSSGFTLKPDAAMLEAACDGLGVRPADTVLVGDSDADVGSARAAGSPVILVSYGYTQTPAAELGADAVIDHLSELPGILATMRAAASPA